MNYRSDDVEIPIIVNTYVSWTYHIACDNRIYNAIIKNKRYFVDNKREK